MTWNPFSRKKTQKSRVKAESHEEVHVISQKTTVSTMPSVPTAVHHHIHDSHDTARTEDKNDIPTPIKGTVKIFEQDIAPPVTKYTLPALGERITSTHQLAYCLSLLQPSSLSDDELDETERAWSQARAIDTHEKERLQSTATDIIKAFARDELKKSDAVVEVVSLTAVLDKHDYRKLLQVFVDGIDQSVLLKVYLLDGLSLLIRNAAQGYLQSDDLVKILNLLNTRLVNTHSQSTGYIYLLSLTMSSVLDSMVDSQVKGLSREQLHEPLSEYLKGLKESSDPYLVYQAAYAYQALQHVPDDETILQSMIRRTGKVVRGISGVVSAVKALDLAGFISGLQSIQDNMDGAIEAFGLIKDTYENVMALKESGEGLLDSLQSGFSFTRKSVWYPALRGLDRLIQEGRFVEFEKLVREAPCKYDSGFQWGVCQRLGEISINNIWDDDVRKDSVAFLGEIYADDDTWGQSASIKQLILFILKQVADSDHGTISKESQTLLQQLRTNGNAKKQLLYQGYENSQAPHPLMVNLPSQEYPLLNYALNKPDVESPLLQLKRNRLQDQGRDIYISPRAKTSTRAIEDFDLTSKAQEFLDSDRKVFLILGDSGSGKSTFNRALEINLWERYEKESGKIPLFIHLPSIDKPEYDLIDKHLLKCGFAESEIVELKLYREFVVICDGYDESQQTRNLYMSNLLNQPGGWRAQMVISCRTEYTGVDYRHCFEPTNWNTGRRVQLFQEAVIVPFNKDQIQDYVSQYVLLTKPSWEAKNYMQALKQIPNLQDLVKNPFLLKLALEVLPRILHTDSQFSTVRITRVRLYDEFVAQWIERGKIRLGEMDLSEASKDIFKKLSHSGFKQNGIDYFKELTTAIYDNQNGHPVVSYLEHRDRSTWKGALFNSEDGKDLLREAIPITCNADQYRFIHKSVLEYGLSLAVIDPNQADEPESAPSRRGSVGSDLSFDMPVLTNVTSIIAASQSLLDSPLGRMYLLGEPSTLQFLTDRVQQQPTFKDQLLAVVEKSKTDKMARIGAANAITILVRAGVTFIGADLRGIQIPRADLSNGMFDSAQLQGADLRKANLRNIWLRSANLDGGQMTGVQFGELPLLKEESSVVCGAYSLDGETFAVGTKGGDINLYSTSSWSRVQSLRGHSSDVLCLTFSSTGNHVASGSMDSTVRVWDVGTGDCIHVLVGHDRSTESVVYSPRGDYIASGSFDSVKLWDASTGDCIHTLQGSIYVVYSPKGDKIAYRGQNTTVQIWDIDVSDCIRTLQGHSASISSIAYSPKGDQIASGSLDNTVRLWDVDTGDCTHILQGQSGFIFRVVYSPKGDQVAYGCMDGIVRLWDTETGNCIHTLQGHSECVYSVAFSPKGDHIASGSKDSTVRLWDIVTGDSARVLQGHFESVDCIIYSPKGNQIASGSRDWTVRLWTIGSVDSLHTFHGHNLPVNNVVFSPKGKLIASASEDTTVRLWDPDSGDCVHALQGHSQNVTRVAYSPEGAQIASGGWDSTVRLWDTETGDCVHTLQGHSGIINVIVYLPNGSQIATGSQDKNVRLWDVETGECVQTFQGHTENVVGVVYSPKGDQILSGSHDFTVRQWDAKTGNCIRTLQGHSGPVCCLVQSPKGDQVASASWDNSVRLWSLDTGDCVHTLHGHSNILTSIAYSPKGDRIASGSWDNSVRLWDVDTGNCVHVLQGHTHGVANIAYSPKGDRIASGSIDLSVRVWDVETGQCLVTISGFEGTVNSVDWANNFDGQDLVTGSGDHSVRHWKILKDGDEHRATLIWSSSHGVLTVAGASFNNAQGLSGADLKLIGQRASPEVRTFRSMFDL
ncbi:hypothetical protein BGZ49_003359 [Haplosporangium sp. Z 27]|nr:hypothetical protein BGZ49_003359 [Haplosporangium sp. Z 27]